MKAHEESKLQRSCVKWFRLQYPSMARLLFSIPNGGARKPIEAAIMKAEGITAGVSDLILLVPSPPYHALCIEMKTAKGRQSPLQKEWQYAAERVGNKYVICRNFDEFREEITTYIKKKGENNKRE